MSASCRFAKKFYSRRQDVRLREKLSLPIGIRGPFGSAKAPPAARSDNALRKERGGRRTRIRAEPPARALRGGREKSTRGHCAAGGKNQPTGVARRAGKINPRALCGGREKSTHGHCAAGGENQPTGIVRKKGAERPRRAEILFLRSLALRRAFIAPCRSRQRGSRRPSRRSRGRSRLSRRARADELSN